MQIMNPLLGARAWMDSTAVDVPPPFGAAQWREHFHLDVGYEPPLPPDFSRFWHSENPFSPGKKVYETHYPPILRPRFVQDISEGPLYKYSLTALESLRAHRRALEYRQGGGGDSHLRPFSHNFVIHCSFSSDPGPACWIVARKDVVAKNETYKEQVRYMAAINAETGMGYEEAPSLMDLVTVMLVRHALTGEKFLGGPSTDPDCRSIDTPDETYLYRATASTAPRRTYSHCKEGTTYSAKNDFNILYSVGRIVKAHRLAKGCMEQSVHMIVGDLDRSMISEFRSIVPHKSVYTVVKNNLMEPGPRFMIRDDLEFHGCTRHSEVGIAAIKRF